MTTQEEELVKLDRVVEIIQDDMVSKAKIFLNSITNDKFIELKEKLLIIVYRSTSFESCMFELIREFKKHTDIEF